MKHILSKTLLSLSILVTASAYAANGYVTENVYLRAGPDPGYPSVAMLNAGTPVAIEGCVNGWSWCDVDAGGNRGWVDGNLLQDDYRGQRVLVPQYGVQIGIPIIGFVFATYWQDHYRHQSWYSQRQRWSQVRPRYNTVVVQRNVYEDSRASTQRNSRGARDESHRAAVVAAPAPSVHTAKPARPATPQHRALANARAHTSPPARVHPAEHKTAAPSARTPAARNVAQHAGTQPRTVAQHRVAARPNAQPDKQRAKSKSDKNKHPDSSGQH